jgi:hypothetical protein
MKQVNFVKGMLAASIAFAANSALALEAASLPVGGMALTPTMKLTESYDTNIGKNAASVNSWVTTLAPSLSLVAEERMNAYALDYGFVAERFHSARNSDNVDHSLNGKAHMEFSSRSRLDLNLGYQKNEDTDLANDEDYKQTSFGAVYGYGSKQAKMQLEFGANKQIKRYDYTDFDGKEVDILNLSAIAYYQVAPATKAVVEYRNTDYDYASQNVDIDSNANTYLAGVTWDATAKTTGSAKFGRTSKDFDQAGKADPSSNVWEVSVTWSPRTYSNVTATFNQSLGEGSGGSAEDYIDTDALTLNWNHQWSSFISTDVNYSKTDEDYKGISRKDDTVTYGVGVTYNLARNIDVGLGYSTTDKNSTVNSEDYDRDLISATLNVGF